MEFIREPRNAIVYILMMMIYRAQLVGLSWDNLIFGGSSAAILLLSLHASKISIEGWKLFALLMFYPLISNEVVNYLIIHFEQQVKNLL